jgi:hypothetical protein
LQNQQTAPGSSEESGGNSRHAKGEIDGQEIKQFAMSLYHQVDHNRHKINGI